MRLYVVPSKMFRCYATTESLHVGITSNENQVSPIVTDPDKSQRYKLIIFLFWQTMLHFIVFAHFIYEFAERLDIYTFAQLGF